MTYLLYNIITGKPISVTFILLFDINNDFVIDYPHVLQRSPWFEDSKWFRIFP